MKIDDTMVKKEVDNLLPQIKELRQHLHAHPELSLQEHETAAFVRAKLEPLHIDILPAFLSTDVVALLNAQKANRNITLRADMDALPIREKTGLPYCSTKNNVMHACGHDGHMAMLLGAAIILEKFKDQLNGSVRFVFQPGEEVVAAGRDLVNKGILNAPKPSAVLALHGWPGFPVGTICSRAGAMMAAADIFKITIRGQGGHGSKPEQAKDPILSASKIINELYLLPSRKFSALESVALSVCKLQAGTSSNVIPDQAMMEGTVRYFSKSAGENIKYLFEKVIKDECHSSGTEYHLNYERPYLATINNEEVVSNCKNVVQRINGKNAWIDLPEPVMASEDFSFYLEENPGAMFFIGLGEDSAGLHSDSFDFNDHALRNGIIFLVGSAIGLLNQTK